MFNDLDTKRWSYKSIERIYKAGLMSGYPDGSFRPDQPLTREEMASILNRLLMHIAYFSYLIPSVMPAVVCIHRGDGLGCGCYIKIKDGVGYILTNRHVVQMQNGTFAKEFTLIKEDRPNFKGQLATVDAVYDLAIVKTSEYLPEPLKLAEEPVNEGDPVAVIGAPFGYIESVTAGIVSSVDRGDLFQIDAPINPGNSGGPVINTKGEMVGITVAKLMSPAEGIGFAIKLEKVKDFLTRAEEAGLI